MGLKSYLAKRIAVAIITLWIVATLIFFLFIVFPGNPTKFLIDPTWTPARRAELRKELGIDDPLPVLYLRYMKGMFSFGLVPPYFGVSFNSGLYVSSELAWRLPLTASLLGLALIGEIIVGIPLGVLAASKRGSKLDVGIMTAGLFTWGVPTFFIQLIALLFFISYMIGTLNVTIFPPGGWMSIPPPTGTLPFLADVAWHLALPALTLVIASAGGWALYTRNMLLDALTQDYTLTARAKGLSERTVLFRHALRTIYPPLVTLITLSIPHIVTGAIITEQIFGLPGIGQWYVNSISLGNPDYPVVQAILFIFAFLTIVCNLIADFLYGAVDPRIRVGMRR
jgi:peptide/nickel transport system permease protein